MHSDKISATLLNCLSMILSRYCGRILFTSPVTLDEGIYSGAVERNTLGY